MASTVLVADDEPVCLEIVARLMKRLGYAVTVVRNGAEVLRAVDRAVPDLILLDVEMPQIDGIEVCRRLKGNPVTRLIPVVLITSLSGKPDRVRGIEAGADDFLTKPVDPEELEARARALLRLKHHTDELECAESVIVSLALTVEARDAYTKGHCERLAQYATCVGNELGLSRDQLAALNRGAYLHDIGKIGIADSVLLKQSALSRAEFAIMREHAVIGERLCGSLQSLRLVRPIIRHHHERLDGSGYPDGLRGDDIPLLAQIVGIVDAYDAMTTTRPYRPAGPAEHAFAELRAEVGAGRLRRDLVDLFMGLVRNGGVLPETPLEAMRH